jgi:hypothetical protein
MSHSRTIVELANIVASRTTEYNDYLVANNLPIPTHSPSENEIPVEVPPEIDNLRQEAIEASHDLHELLIGPFGVSVTAYARVSTPQHAPSNRLNHLSEHPSSQPPVYIQKQNRP